MRTPNLSASSQETADGFHLFDYFSSTNSDNNNNYPAATNTTFSSFSYTDMERGVKYPLSDSYVSRQEELPPPDVQVDPQSPNGFHYSEDFDLVRQLQEKTKSLMDASRYSNYYSTISEYPAYGNIRNGCQPQIPLLSSGPDNNQHFSGNYTSYV